MRIATKEQIRRIEQTAIAGGLSVDRLMENAGSAAAKYIREWSGAPCDTVILCGNGNNGGDGFVVARKLVKEGYPVTVVLTDGWPLSQTAKTAFSLMGDVPIIDLADEPYRAAAAVSGAKIVVDAVYGIGFRGNLPDAVAQLFQLVNPETMLSVAIDVPSGLQCDTGEWDANTFRATHTVTFIAAKPALIAAENAVFCGAVTVSTIGIDEQDIVAELQAPFLQEQEIRAMFCARDLQSHKGTYGHLLAVCGSVGMAGAAILSARAALRSGVGLLTVAVPESIYPIVATAVPEAMFVLLPETEDGVLAETARPLLDRAMKGKTGILLGCGLGKGASVESMVSHILQTAKCPIVLDADGINAVLSHINILKTVKNALIVTPHPGEMARMICATVPEVQQNRVETATDFCGRYGAITVLKGHHTVVASRNGVCINPTGNPGMATGGSGDVLAGIIASLVAQGMVPENAAKSGVYLHGKAGDIVADRYSQHGLLPSDMIEELKGLFSIFE